MNRSLSRLEDSLPDTALLTDEEWQARHRVVLGVLAGLLVVVGIVGVANHGPAHSLGELGLGLVSLGIAARARNRLVAMAVVSLGILAAAGLMVHFTDGLIESHFTYFVVLPVIALYHDWRPFLLSALFVAVSHAVMGLVTPAAMYNHPAAIANPVLWGVIHAAYLLGLAAALTVHWHFSERPRHALRAALEDLRSAQTQLVAAQKLESMGSLAAGLAHEINTPVQFVGTNLEFITDAMGDIGQVLAAYQLAERSLQESGEGQAALAPARDIADAVDLAFLLEEVPAAVSQSQDGIARVAEIVRAMRGFSHPGEDPVPTDVNQLVTDTMVLSRQEWSTTAQVSVHLAEDLPEIPVVPRAFNQVLLNLLINASHAIQDRPGEALPRGRIRLRTGLEDGNVVVEVADNGCGIPDDVAPRVFDQFFTTKEVGRGTGQGLSLAHSIVSEMGGVLTFDSTVGVGTTFRFALPLERPPLVPTGVPAVVGA